MSRHFPDFFTTRGPIPVTVKPLKFGNRTYYQTTLALDEESHSTPHLKPYMDNDDEMLDCADMEENYEIVLTKSGKFSTSFHVPSSLLPFIIGAKGSKLKTLQRNTNTTIKIPRMNEKGEVTIIGDTERKVASARTQISLIVTQRKDRLRPTHFISIPLTSDLIKTNLLKFQDEVLKNPPRGVTDKHFQNPVKMHLTVVVLKILDEEELILAKKTLQNCYDEVIANILPKSTKHIVTVKGLEIMNDDPSNVNVLYGKITSENDNLMDQLNKMSDAIVTYFCKAGLAKREYEKVKFHMTVMNSSFLEDRKATFDATDILREYGDYYFGTSELERIDLCIRGTTKTDSGEIKYYDIALNITL
ncbi:hypothetical protein GWI33_018908 [Rhynchophorus ferrugineus]|uniref:K Homology domain-containing protein n=1 Tax=Rhynchophorus ferrugineus TaxID=354439 RepID=A0A834HZ74_RHYFE|nr:hypothetical protein GWI33_018908 [Rhynchophorus ferrugineus]